jgi:glycosyltransferase involved in cell wall biosynthesis
MVYEDGNTKEINMIKVLLLLPAYNEAKILPWCITQLNEYAVENLQNFEIRMAVLDNGSDDDTAKVVSELQKSYSNLDYYHTPIKGRGNVLRFAWQNLDFEIALYMDADLAVELSAIKQTINAVANDQADIAIGSRYAQGAKIERSLARSIISVGYNVLTKLIIGLKVKDAQCGFKAIRKAVALELLPLIKDKNWFFDTELLSLAEHQKMKIIEIPVSWVETRPVKRKSKVKVVNTIINYVKSLLVLRWRYIVKKDL